MKNYGYRKLFQESTGIKFCKRGTVHHLDGNHYNNVIENLVCIDYFYHRNYHMALLKAFNPNFTSRYSYVNEEDMELAKNIISKAIENRDFLIKNMISNKT